MNRPTSALGAVLTTMLAVVPATAQQAPRTLPLPTSESCSGCFAYLEFPPPADGDAASSLATRHQAMPGTVKQQGMNEAPAPGPVASAR